MTETEFCIEYVKRIPRPPRTKTTMEMIRIVEYGRKIDVVEMFDDKGINSVNTDAVGRQVYKYIRDNQEEFATLKTKETKCNS